MPRPKGFKHTPETKAKMAAAKLGRPRPDVAERNRSQEMRDLPRVISDEARQRMSAERTTHGHARKRGTGQGATKTYQIWAAMVQRCINSNHKDWELYGGRGIRVCDRWRNSFEDFLADMGPKPAGRSLDRINNDGHYEPSNCRWATAVEQANNKRPRRARAVP